MRTFILYIFTGLCLFTLLSCGEDPAIEQSNTPVFPDLETITLINPGQSYTLISISGTNTRFLFNAPNDVSFFVLGVMNSVPEVSGETITNADANWIAGNRTGLSGFSTSSVDLESLLIFDSTTKNFFPSTYFKDVYGGSYIDWYWFVLGYDQWGNLTHSSPAYKINIDNTP